MIGLSDDRLAERDLWRGQGVPYVTAVVGSRGELTSADYDA
jgi:hypothetical protein